MKWYQFTPSDTLFFRGAEPMVGGMDYDTRLAFPPSVSVIQGAVRTAALAQKRVSIKAYRNGDPIGESIGAYGRAALFKVVGPFIRKEADDFVPAPFTWYYDGNLKGLKINIVKPFPLSGDLRERLGLRSSSALTNWAVSENELKTVGGNWISLGGLSRNRARFEDGKSIFMSERGRSALFSLEARTGIAIDRARRVEESRLYSSRHIRLNAGVSLIWGIEGDCGLGNSGVLSLGGEQRFGSYQELTHAPDFPKAGDQYLALSPIPVNDESVAALVGTGEIIYRGGWSLAGQFHKDMVGYYPAGSVFSKNVNNCCIPF